MFALVVPLVLVASAQTPTAPPGVRLEDLTWLEAEKLLTAEAVVVIPIGAAAKEHGPHLKLKNDFTLADYLTRRVLDQARVIVAPTLTYHFYPSFLEYPGSTSLTLETARDMTVQVVRTLAAYGPKRFYALNTGVSTVRALEPAAQELAAEGILFRYTVLGRTLGPIEKQVAQQAGGTHADEIETSMMLYIDPGSVDMSRAAKDYDPAGKGPLSRTRKPGTVYSTTGIFGDATLATRDKGKAVVEAFVPALVREIEETRVAPLPAARPVRSPSAAPAAPSRGTVPGGRTEVPALGAFQDERAIQDLLGQFMVAWTNQDSWGVASLWTEDGEILHADGVVERMRQTILEQRAQMFVLRGYRSSQHYLSAGAVRFIAPGVALVDATWRLAGVFDANGKALPMAGGPCTLVTRKVEGEGWRIISLRYDRRTNDEPQALTHAPGVIPR
jgi:creatinine amidohydrolase